MNQNDKNKLEKFGMTQNELDELRYHYVDRYVDNMSTKDLVQYVFDDMLRYTEDLPEVDFLDEDETEWLHLLRGKIDNIMLLNVN